MLGHLLQIVEQAEVIFRLVPTTFYLTVALVSRGFSMCGSFATHLARVALEPRPKVQVLSASYYLRLRNVEQTRYLAMG